MARLQELPIPQKFLVVKLGLCLDESGLRSGQAAANALDRVDGVYRRCALVVRVKVRSVMRSSRFHEHANHDPKEAADFRHRMMISRVAPPWLGCDI